MRQIGIRDLDMPRLERLIEDGIDAFPGVHPSTLERKAFLKTGLPTDVLLRLPIHDRSDGTVGSAAGLFREDGRWSIPDRFQSWVVTVGLFKDPEIRLEQERIIPGWSPEAQIKTALSQAEPNSYPEEILDAIYESCRQNVALPSALIASLRTTRWLAADGRDVAPKDLLAMLPAVDEAAEQHLAGYISVGRLPECIRTHPGFGYAQEMLMSDRPSSVAALARMIADAGLQGPARSSG